jgi:Flp pilus assembly protein TadD
VLERLLVIGRRDALLAAILLAAPLAGACRRGGDPAQLGYEALREGRAQDAIALLRDAIKAKPSDAGSHFNLGVALEKVGYQAEALTEFEAAHRLDPKNASYRTGLAQTKKTLAYRAMLKGDHEESVRINREVLDLTPDDAFAWYNLSVSLLRLHKNVESNEARNRASALDKHFRLEVPR